MMNVVNSGSRYQIYGEDVKTYKKLPVASYEVCFNKMTGFFLTLRPDLVVKEEKVYGNHEARVNKVLHSFSLTDRNLGVILSGQKGIGKSLFAKVVANKSLEVDLPVIMVTDYFPGIANFLGSIEQEVVVIFDEFEKNFSNRDDTSPQDELLSLFDGTDGGKKLFIVTCNEMHRVNSYMVNRPGRFHYHFTIKNPSDEEIIEYMHDKLDEQYYPVIDRVVKFAKTVNVTYDYLRAIAFELNQGISLDEALADLNITNDDSVGYEIKVVMNNGSVFTRECHYFNLFGNTTITVRCWNRNDSVLVDFDTDDIEFIGNQVIVNGENVDLCLDEDDFPKLSEEEFEKLESELKVNHILFTRCDYTKDKKIHLTV